MAVEKLASSTFLLLTTGSLVLERWYLGQCFSNFNMPINYLDITSFKSRFWLYRSRKGSETAFLWSSQVLALHGSLSSKVFWTCYMYERPPHQQKLKFTPSFVRAPGYFCPTAGLCLVRCPGLQSTPDSFICSLTSRHEEGERDFNRSRNCTFHFHSHSFGWN